MPIDQVLQIAFKKISSLENVIKNVSEFYRYKISIAFLMYMMTPLGNTVRSYKVNSNNLFQLYQGKERKDWWVWGGKASHIWETEFTSCQSGPKGLKGKRHSKEGVSPLVDFKLKMNSGKSISGSQFTPPMSSWILEGKGDIFWGTW